MNYILYSQGRKSPIRELQLSLEMNLTALNRHFLIVGTSPPETQIDFFTDPKTLPGTSTALNMGERGKGGSPPEFNPMLKKNMQFH